MPARAEHALLYINREVIATEFQGSRAFRGIDHQNEVFPESLLLFCKKTTRLVACGRSCYTRGE